MRENKEQNEQAATSTRVRPPGPIALLKDAWQKMRLVSGRLLLLIVVAQLVISLVATPLISWVFRAALRANGMLVLDTNTFTFTWGFTITVALLFLILLIVMWLVVAQFSAILVLLQNPNFSAKDLLGALGQLIKKAFKRSSWSVVLYVIVILPLSGFGFVSTLIQGVKVPNFITGEMQKDPLHATLLTVGVVLLAYVNIRFAMTLPLFAMTETSGNGSMKRSWSLTKGLRPWSFVIATVLLTAIASLVLVALFYVLLLPTVIADAIAPGASWTVAAIGLGVGHVVTLILLGYTAAMLAGILTSYGQARGALPEQAHETSVAGHNPRRVAFAAIAVACVAASIAALPALRDISEHPSTLVIAHRGWTQEGVENTIPALEATASIHADAVEMDTMRTKDGKFIVMHDTNLGRLAGINRNVRDMTFDELVGIEVHDTKGHTATIPSLVDYVTRAKELHQPLLIEVKLGGAEPDAKQNVADVLAVLRENDLLEGNMFHTLDFQTAQELKRQRPDAAVGYIMPFAALGVPDTLADFLVLEESAATPAMQKHTEDAGLGFIVWTVDNEEAMRLRFRQGIDALITDRPDVAMGIRGQINEESGLAPRLHDMMLRFMRPF